MTLQLPPTELTFTGPALPESFIQHELEHALGKALPSAKDAEAGWKALLKSLREPLTSAGSIRVRNVVINPVMKVLDYAGMIAAEDVRTREGDELGGMLLLPSPVNGGGTKGGGLRVWAVAYEDDLDAPSKRGQNYRFSPGRVAERVLLATGERIGLLTNGLELRLIFSDPARRASFASFSLSQWKQLRYTDPVPDAFRVLIAFAQADAQRDARLQDVIEQARLKQGQVTKDLRVQARQAVEAFVQSVLDHPANKEILRDYVANDMLAKQLWREALTMIYRMLFILRGESGGRETPPFSFASTSLWRNTYSPSNAQPGNLAWVAQQVREEGMPSGEFLEAGLRAIFKAFEHGLNATELHIAPLGGALFGAESTPLLDRLKWGEHGCAELIDNLLRAPRGKGQGRSLVRLSYRDLGVEELGRVYEALLELEPGISAEAMVRLRRAKLEVVVPLEQGEKYRPKDEGGGMRDEAIEEAEESIDAEDESQGDASQSEISNQKSKIEWIEAIPPNRFYLRVGLGRKSSGGHYTPDTFVRFLVQETLGPSIEALSPKDDPQPLAILRLNVLDGAMGSGHILIGACRFMGERLYEAGVACAERGLWERIPVEVAPYLPGRRPEGESEAGLSAEKARAMCKRLVAVHCLYGVDKNPLAVSLAKVSLWLESFAEGLPLTFLDHRLVCGDSLLGPINLFGDAANAAAADSPMTPPYATTPIDLALAQGVKAQLRDRLGVALQRVRDLDATVGTDEADIAAKHNAKRDLEAALQPFIDLCVAWSGGIMLGREHVDEDGYREAMQLVATGAWPIDPLADDGSLTAGFRTMLQKGRDAGVLVYPLVYPEVFFPTSDVDHMEGFDAEVMNPPWEAVRPKAKEFFATYDLGIVGAPTKKERGAVERRLKSDQDVMQRFNSYEQSFLETHRILDVLFRWQVVLVNNEKTGGDPDASKYFAERVVALLRETGYLGLVLPSAFHANEGATGVRRLYFAQTALKKCFSFENRRKLFEIDSRFKFALIVGQKNVQGTTEFDAGFYLHDDNWLFVEDQGDASLRYNREFIERTGGEYLSFMELRSTRDLAIAETCFKASPSFGAVTNDLGLNLGRELHMSDDAYRFTPIAQVISDSSDPRRPDEAERLLQQGYLILHEGKTFNQYTDIWEDRPRYLVHISEMQDRGLLLQRMPYYRAVFRNIASSTNERTSIFEMLPPGCLTGNSCLTEIAPQNRANAQVLALVACANSFSFDWCARQMVGSNLNQFILNRQPLPWKNELRGFYAHSSLRLVSNHAGYAPLWTEQLGDEWREGAPRHTWPVLAGDDARWDVRAAIDAVVAQAYGLSREQYAHVLSTFSHKSYPSAPKVCLAKFDELSEMGLEAFTRKYDPYWDVPLVESLPRPVIELPNLTPGEGRVVAEGRVEYGATDMFGNPLQTDLFGEVVISVKGKRGRKRN